MAERSNNWSPPKLIVDEAVREPKKVANFCAKRDQLGAGRRLLHASLPSQLIEFEVGPTQLP